MEIKCILAKASGVLNSEVPVSMAVAMGADEKVVRETVSGLIPYVADVEDGQLRILIGEEPYIQYSGLAPDGTTMSHMSVRHSSGRDVTDEEVAEIADNLMEGVKFVENSTVDGCQFQSRHFWEYRTEEQKSWLLSQE